MFMIPMHYFYHQVGPDFQGSVGISLRWPDLEPLPPGARHADDYFDKNMDYMVHVMVDYLDKVDIETRLTKDAHAQLRGSNPDDPTESLEQRVRGEPMHGLTPYYVDLEKFKKHLIQNDIELGFPAGAWKHDRLLKLSKDWHIQQDDTGKVHTMIVCDNHLIPGDALVGETIVRAEGTERMNQCRHDFVIEQYKLRFSARYASSLLKDWQRIEAAIRGVFYRTHVKQGVNP